MNPLATQLATFDVHPDDRRVLDRIAKRFDRTTSADCILLTGAASATGRPRIQVDGYTTNCARVIVALRDDKWLYESWKWQTRHLCGNDACCNPDHLTWGTQADNEADKRMHGTAMQGEHHWNSDLTEQQALAILVDPRPHALIAADYGKNERTVSDIKRGRTWRHLHEEQERA